MDKLTYIICGKLYNGIDAEFKENYKILVKNDLIEAVGPDIPQPESAEVINLSDATVTPGMIDAHMHMDYIDWHTIREEVYTTSEEAKTLAIVRTAQKTLSRGFTTVRHPGGITRTGGTGCKEGDRKWIYYRFQNCSGAEVLMRSRKPRRPVTRIFKESGTVQYAAEHPAYAGGRKRLFCQCRSGRD